MPKKILRTQIKVFCNNCDHSFEINERMQSQEKWWAANNNSIPFGAKQSSSMMSCPKCSETNFRISFDYQNIYRIRCRDCKEMFDSPETYHQRCPKCEEEYLRVFSMLGA